MNTKAKNLPQKSKVYRFVLAISFIWAFFVITVMAQSPPGLPGPPDQSPIDHGLLGVVPAAGDWATNRLRN